jgi:CheY-like chemotaxis protein
VRVLIVDDDPDISFMMRTLMQSEGWDTGEAMSGEEALLRLDELTGYDAIVLDYRMPGLTGIELARNLREEGVFPPMILCSAYLNPDVEAEAKALGVPTVDKMDLRRLIDMIRNQAGGDESE